MIQSRLNLITSLLLVTIFIYASGMKLWAYANSSVGLDYFPFVKSYHRLLFWGLMIGQLTIAGLLIVSRTMLFGLFGAFFLLASLSTYLYLMLHYSDHIPCSCIGIIPDLSWNGHMWLTIAFTILVGINIVIIPKDIHARG